MSIFMVLSLIGGLALFLYGMQMMGDGLKKVSGGKLEMILEKLTSNKIMAVLLGAGVTAVIQSSSATTVMVVGFVNSGIMSLSRAVGVIMGANVGTTVTAWILSMTEITGQSLFLQLLKPSSFSPILAIVGVAILMVSKKEKQRDGATIMLGFAILMFGMEMMSGAVEPLAESEEFQDVLLMFANPVLGMLVGCGFTILIQSSSASVGILQALSATGAVTNLSAIPLIMGANVGSTTTALISSIGASRNAKRAALVHFYFNIIKTVTFMVLFYSLNAVFHFAFANEPATAVGIAVIHSSFNIAAAIVFTPVSAIFEKMAYVTLPKLESEEEDKIPAKSEIQILDPRFLETPGYALEQCKNAAIDMANYSREALFLAIDQIRRFDKKGAARVINLEELVDHYEDELGSYLVKLSSRHLSEKDSQELSVLLHCIGDFERISDHAINIMESAREMNDKNLSFSKKAEEELAVFTSAIKDIVNTSILVFQEEDLKLALQVEPLEEVIDHLNAEVKKRHIKRLRKGKCTIEMGFILSDISTNYERVSDHCSNIALCLLQLNEDNFDTHMYQENISSSDNEEFNEEYKRLRTRYQLP